MPTKEKKTRPLNNYRGIWDVTCTGKYYCKNMKYRINMVCRFVFGKPIQKICMPKSVGGITWPKHVHAQSQFGAVKIDL